MVYVLADAFSLSMIPSSLDECVLHFEKVSLDPLKLLLPEGTVKSVVEHQATASVLSQLLGIPVSSNRVPYTLSKDESLVVFQLKTRLEEGKVLSEDELKALEFDIFVVDLI